jgi:hypothetical protein
VSPDTTCQRCHQHVDEPRAVLAVILLGFHLPVGGVNEPPSAKGESSSSRPKVTRLVRCGSGETKDKNLFANFSNSTVAPRTLAPFVEEWTHLLEHTRCRCFSQELFDRAARRETTKCVWEIGSSVLRGCT